MGWKEQKNFGLYRSTLIVFVLLFSAIAGQSQAAVTIRLATQSGGIYSYDINFSTCSNCIAIMHGQQATLSGMSGVTSATVLTSSFLNECYALQTRTDSTVTFAEVNDPVGCSGFGTSTEHAFQISSSSTTLGTIQYSIQTSVGTFTGTTQGPVRAQACVPDPQPTSMDFSDKCGYAYLLTPYWSKTFDDGTRLDAGCSVEDFAGVFPVPAYMAWYTDQNGVKSRIAQCLFRDGINLATYTAGHLASNPSKSCISSVDWINFDGGGNDGQRTATNFLGHPIIFTTPSEPYIDVVHYHLNATTKKLSWDDQKFPYTNTTQTADDGMLTLVLEGKLLPETRLTYAEDPQIGPAMDAAFGAAWLQMQGDPGGPMRFIPGCDLNGDGICNSDDDVLLQAAIGTCAGQGGYIPRIDFDGEGCITTADAEVVQASFERYRAGCTRSKGYWKTHSEWPLKSMNIGGNRYSQSQLKAIVELPVRGNGAVSLAQQLIAARLNVAAGASGVAVPLGSSDALISTFAHGLLPPFGNAYIAPATTSPDVDAISRYNEGQSGPPACMD